HTLSTHDNVIPFAALPIRPDSEQFVLTAALTVGRKYRAETKLLEVILPEAVICPELLVESPVTVRSPVFSCFPHTFRRVSLLVPPERHIVSGKFDPKLNS